MGNPTLMHTDLHALLAQLSTALAERRSGALSPDAFIHLWRTHGPTLTAQLPPRFKEVMEDVLMRLESSRLFSGDSCSFSDASLLDALAMWVERAQLRLNERPDA